MKVIVEAKRGNKVEYRETHSAKIKKEEANNFILEIESTHPFCDNVILNESDLELIKTLGWFAKIIFTPTGPINLKYKIIK